MVSQHSSVAVPPPPCLLQVPYRLHAVLVHEGQANAGHYWAYIYDPHQRRWMKYNDVSVTKSTWEELVRDSFGGYRNASAYCLMYINDKKPFLIEGMVSREEIAAPFLVLFNCNSYGMQYQVLLEFPTSCFSHLGWHM